MEKRKQNFLEHLELYAKLGIKIWVEDSAVTPQEAYLTCVVKENGNYMCDFIFEDDEKLTELHFHKVI